MSQTTNKTQVSKRRKAITAHEIFSTVEWIVFRSVFLIITTIELGKLVRHSIGW